MDSGLAAILGASVGAAGPALRNSSQASVKLRNGRKTGASN
jgi:hypothetical protein